MADDTESHTIKVLQELRSEMRQRFDNIDTRIEGLTHVMTLMAGHSHDLDERVEKLEAETLT